MRNLIILFLITGLQAFALKSAAQCSTIDNWVQHKEGMRTLCFYPTTLRMINVNKEKSFNDIVRDIKKLKIILVDIAKSGYKKGDVNLLTQGIRAESYKDMLQVQRGKQLIYVFVKENKQEKPVGYTGIMVSEDQLILIDMKGSLSPATIQQIISGNVSFGAVSKIIDLTGKKEDKRGPKEKPGKK